MRSTLILCLLLIFPIGICIPAASAQFTHSLKVGPANNQVLHVWFDAAPQLTTLYPPAYLFNVAAKTAPGLWITSLVWNFGDGSTLTVPFSAQSQVSDIRAHVYATQGDYCVTVTAYDSAGNVATVSTSLTPNYDFTLTATSTSQNVAPGNGVSYSVAVGASVSACGTPVQVNLAVSTPTPAGITWALNPTSGNTSFTSTLQVQTATSTAQGTYTINIVGTSANVTHSTTVTLVVSMPYFAVSVTPSSLFVPPQLSGERTNSTTVTIQSFDGFRNPVQLAVSGTPSGMTSSFSSATLTPPPNGAVTSILTMTTPCSVAPGSYAISVQGVSGSLVSKTVLNVSVNACTEGFSFNIFWLLLIGGIIGLLLLIPILFLLFRRRPAAPVPPTTVMPTVVPVVPPPPEPEPNVVPFPKVAYCETCGGRLTLVAPFRRYCPRCDKYY
jgi:hypothetical protein